MQHRLATLIFAISVLPAALAEETAEQKKWEFSLSANSYFVRDDQNFIQPTVTADCDWLHLEA